MYYLKQFIKTLTTENTDDNSERVKRELLAVRDEFLVKYIDKFNNEFDNKLQISEIQTRGIIRGDNWIQLEINLTYNEKHVVILTSDVISSPDGKIHIRYKYQALKDYSGREKRAKEDYYRAEEDMKYIKSDDFRDALNNSNTLLEFENNLNEKNYRIVHCSREQKAIMEAFVSSNLGKALGAVFVSNKKSRGGYKYEHAVVTRRQNAKAYSLLLFPPFDKARISKKFGNRNNQIIYSTKNMSMNYGGGNADRYCTLPIEKLNSLMRVCKTIDEFDILAKRIGKLTF